MDYDLPMIRSYRTAVLLFLTALSFSGCQPDKPKDARAIAEAERSPKFVPYFPEKQPSHTFRNHVEETAWQKHYDKLAPKKGTEAPEIELQDISGTKTFRLSDFRNKQPVALIFGSFT